MNRQAKTRKNRWRKIRTGGLSLRRAVPLTLAVGLAAMSISASAQPVPRARPEQVGFSAARLDRINLYFQERIAKGDFPGAVVLISRGGKIVLFNAFGFSDVEAHKKMQVDQIFRLASMSKPLTAAGLMTLYDQGRFQMSDPLSKYLPEFAGVKVRTQSKEGGAVQLVDPNRPPTMQDILRHTAGFSYGGLGEYGLEPLGNPYTSSIADVTSAISKYPLQYQPGERWEYSVSSDIQGRLIEILSGMSLSSYLSKSLFTPLAMNDTGFLVPSSKYARFGPQYSKDAQGHWRPAEAVVAPNGVRVYRMDQWLGRAKMFSGGGGLASTALDMWRFAQMMLNGGELDGARVLAPRTVEIMSTDQISTIVRREFPVSGYGYGFGVETTNASALPAGSYWWGGGFGTHFWIDPKNQVVAIFMTQTLPSGIDQEKERIAALVYGAMLNPTTKKSR